MDGSERDGFSLLHQECSQKEENGEFPKDMWVLESRRESGQEGTVKVAWLGGTCVEGGVRAPEEDGLTLAEGAQRWRGESGEGSPREAEGVKLDRRCWHVQRT